MLTASTVAAYLALIWSAVLLWLALGAAIRRYQLHARFRGRGPSSAAGRRVLMIRPCAGPEPALLDNLLSIRTLVTEAELRVIATIDHPDDGARAAVEAAIEQLRAEGFDIRLEIHPPTGPNRKASMLAAVLHERGRDHEFVVNVDSNVDLADFNLDALLAPVLGPMGGSVLGSVLEPVLLGRPRVGVAWAPWVEQRGFPGLGPRASEAVLGGSLTAFPLLCGIHPNGLVGKIWAARMEAIAAVGDFGELTRYLGEDLAMADRLRAAGWTIAVAPVLGRARGGQPSFDQTVERFARWMLVVRAQQPGLLVTYPLFFFATPLVGALALLGVSASPTLSIAALALALSARLVVTLLARFWSGRSLRPIPTLIDALLSDLVLLLAWLRSVSRREVVWRGRRLHVGAGGKLSARE